VFLVDFGITGYTHELSKISEGLVEYETRTKTRTHGYEVGKNHCSIMRSYFFSFHASTSGINCLLKWRPQV
jgi:hypothetical protein